MFFYCIYNVFLTKNLCCAKNNQRLLLYDFIFYEVTLFNEEKKTALQYLF